MRILYLVHMVLSGAALLGMASVILFMETGDSDTPVRSPTVWAVRFAMPILGAGLALLVSALAHFYTQRWAPYLAAAAYFFIGLYSLKLGLGFDSPALIVYVALFSGFELSRRSLKKLVLSPAVEKRYQRMHG